MSMRESICSHLLVREPELTIHSSRRPFIADEDSASD